MTCPTQPWFLRWRDVDPSKHPLDLQAAREIADRLLPHRRSTTDEMDWDALEDLIDRELLRAYGFWAAGWRWAVSEPGSGGPVRAWCCAPHSLPHARTHDRVATALAEWHGWLEALSATFDAIDRDTKDLPPSSRIERAAGRLVALVADRTACEDAWYLTFATTLAWYIERAAPDEDAFHWLTATLGGRFESWITPADDIASDVCADLGAAAGKAPASPGEDALAMWLGLRRKTRSAHERVHESTVISDGHVDYIERNDRERDPLRADRMRSALKIMREAASHGEPLTWALLARCQRIVLGADAEPSFRRGDAYAKAGRERYGLSADTPRDFEQCLVEANASEDALSVAARVYLDVCFFHPFDDGNARAARLGLDYVLTRAGLALHVAEPVFAIPRWADDEYVVSSFIVVLNRFVGHRA